MKCLCGRGIDDLTSGFGDKRNYICHWCGMHHWQGRFWTRAEWKDYIEERDDAKVQQVPPADAAGSI